MPSGTIVLRPGAKATDAADVRPQMRATADLVWEFLAPGFGPGGGWVLQGDDLSRASAALPDLQGHPLLSPYQRLVQRQRAQYGDGGCLAGLLAAGTVRRALDERRLPGVIDGVRLARRQLGAMLRSMEITADAAACLSAIDPDLGPLTDQLPSLQSAGLLELDRIHVDTDDIAMPTWSQGIRITPEPPTKAGGVRVAIVDRCLADLPKDAAWKDVAAGRDAETARWQAARSAIRALGVGLLVCRRDVPEELAGRLRVDGVAWVADAPAGLVHRIAAATGAEAAPRLDHLRPEQTGEATLQRRGGRRPRWSLHGAGPSATLSMPASGPAQQLAVDRADAWLRAVAPVRERPALLPGGGAWQREAANGLRRVADHAPGHAPVGICIVADVLDRIADAVVRNTGADPSRMAHLDAQDAACIMEAAVAAALETAEQILRIDAAYAKRGSAPTDLRGGLGKSGSPKGMPGDIPPLM